MKRGGGLGGLRRGRSLLHVLVAACVLLAPVIANGRPALFFDTVDYLHEGQATLALAHVAWPGRALDPPTAEAAEQSGVWRSIRASRSAAYGLFAYVAIRAGGLWLLAWLQALAAAATIHGFVRAVAGPGRTGVFWSIVAATTLGSGLPFYCGFAMPDVFAGLGVLAVVALETEARSMADPTRLTLFVGAVACAAMHTSHVLTMLALAPAAAVIRWVQTRDLRKGVAAGRWPLAVATVAILMFVGFAALVRARTGEVLRSPPFMSARLLMDGPGRRYLAKACSTGRRPFTLCDYKARRLTVGDDILWSRDRRLGVFATTDAATRVRLSEEDRAFAWAVVRDDPIGVAADAARNATLELVALRIDDPLRSPAFFNSDGFWRRTALAAVVPDAARCVSARATCRARFEPGDLLPIHRLAYVGALLWLAWALSQKARRAPEFGEDRRGAAVSAALLLVVGVVANAAICGALSGPYPRYQARIAWLTIVAAIVLAPRRRERGRSDNSTILSASSQARARLDRKGAAL